MFRRCTAVIQLMKDYAVNEVSFFFFNVLHSDGFLHFISSYSSTFIPIDVYVIKSMFQNIVAIGFVLSVFICFFIIWMYVHWTEPSYENVETYSQIIFEKKRTNTLTKSKTSSYYAQSSAICQRANFTTCWSEKFLASNNIKIVSLRKWASESRCKCRA